MGNSSSSSSVWDVFGRSCFCKPFKKKEYRLIIQGLDSAGKTTILYRLHHDEIVTTSPTIGFNVESLVFKGIEFVAWDVGGRDKMRPLWKHYYPNTDGLVFVVDSNDVDRMEQSRDEFWRMANEEELKGCPTLLLCNKQDLPNAWSPSKIEDFFGSKIASNAPPLKAIGCVANNKKNQRGRWLFLEEGLAWLAEAIEGSRNATADGERNKEEATARTASSNGADDFVDGASATVDEPNKLMSDPTSAGGNITLERFLPIQKGTFCPFAKAAKLWGGSINNSWKQHDQTNKANAHTLTEFCNQVRNGAKLDGFCIELDDPRAWSPHPQGLGQCVKETLTGLSDLDPSGERVMRVNYIGSNGWRFRYASFDFFVTTFAPCYPKNSSRHAFETNRAFLLLQPEISFERHNLDPDTPHTNFQQPQTIRDKTRAAFWKAGQQYYIPSTTNYAAAEHIVKPLKDDGKSVIRWWDDFSGVDAG